VGYADGCSLYKTNTEIYSKDQDAGCSSYCKETSRYTYHMEVDLEVPPFLIRTLFVNLNKT